MMPGVHLEEIWKALYQGYSKKSLDQMLRTRLNVDLDDIVGDGPMKDMTFDLLGVAEREGWQTDLVREAYRFNPRNADLLRIYEKYGLAPAVSVQVAGALMAGAATTTATAGFERRITDVQPLDMNVFRERMTLVETRVCKIEINGIAMGTGFLAGPDAVLTNHHVLASVLAGATSARTVTCVFDYKVLADGSHSCGVAVGLHDADWRLDASEPSQAEANGAPDQALPTAEQLDYALVRLARPVGSEAAAKPGTDATPRGWISIAGGDPHADPAFAPGQPLIIAQHPGGQPLKIAFDTRSIIGLNVNGTRVRYATNTEGGSSGSPCFDLNWRLVALHHYGDPAFGQPRYNQGVPIAKIHARIEAQGAGASLGA